MSVHKTDVHDDVMRIAQSWLDHAADFPTTDDLGVLRFRLFEYLANLSASVQLERECLDSREKAKSYAAMTSWH